MMMHFSYKAITIGIVVLLIIYFMLQRRHERTKRDMKERRRFGNRR